MIRALGPELGQLVAGRELDEGESLIQGGRQEARIVGEHDADVRIRCRFLQRLHPSALLEVPDVECLVVLGAGPVAAVG